MGYNKFDEVGLHHRNSACLNGKAMARHELSLEEQLEGVRAALRSRQTPPQLREGLRRREAQLEDQLRKRSVFSNLFGGQQRSKTMAKTRLFISFDYDHD